MLVIGGTGAGKSRSHALPNLLQACCSYVITDPKAELLRKTGRFLEKEGYEVRVFDLLNHDSFFGYNPFGYVHDDKDVLRLISNLIRNTTPKGANGADPFWEKSETALLQALVLYLLHEAPPEEQNFSMVMEMLGAAEVHEDDDSYQSPLDVLFDRLEERKPDSIAVKQYYCSTMLGKDNEKFGWGCVSQVTGTAAWMDVVSTQYLLGVRPTLKGLLIDPSIPAQWDGYTVERLYRGCKLTIQVENPAHVQHGVKSMTVNGKQVNGAYITEELLNGCKEAQVHVVMG